MKKRISKRVREEAAVLLSAVACGDPWWGPGILDAKHSLGFSNDAFALAYEAHRSLPNWPNDYEGAAAEAEAMLRTGWSPS